MKHYRLISFVTNFLSILASFGLAYASRFGWSSDEPAFNNINDALVLSLLLLSYLIAFFVYNPSKTVGSASVFRRIKEAVINNLIMAVVFTSVSYLTRASDSIPRGFFLYFFVINAALFFVIARITDHLSSRYNKKHRPSAVVYTDRKDFDKVISNILRNGDPNLKITGLVHIGAGKKETLYKVKISERKTKKSPSYTLEKVDNKTIPTLVKISHVDTSYDFTEDKNRTPVEFLTTHPVDSVVISTDHVNSDKIREIIDQLAEMGITTIVTLDSYDIENLNSHFEDYGTLAVVRLAPRIFTDGELFAKRVLDVFGGLVGSVFCLIIGLFLAPLIYLEDRGPIIFKQIRIGRNGRPFTIYKFRSMYIDAESHLKDVLKDNKMKGAMIKVDNDPRITKIGKFIRKASLDEFPQFFNVLKGDMSLVGYRPPVVAEYEQYKASNKRRMMLKPGITGYWQVSGRSNITDFDEVLRLDNYYIDHWSIWFDIKILLKTVLVVFKREGAE